MGKSKKWREVSLEKASKMRQKMLRKRSTTSSGKPLLFFFDCTTKTGQCCLIFWLFVSFLTFFVIEFVEETDKANSSKIDEKATGIYDICSLWCFLNISDIFPEYFLIKSRHQSFRKLSPLYCFHRDPAKAKTMLEWSIDTMLCVLNCDKSLQY